MNGMLRFSWIAIAAVVLLAAADARATTLAGFGRCLKGKGATFYGTAWCPHCNAQRELLGDAMDYVRYVECSTDGEHDEVASACKKAKIDSYPTWTFADGSREGGRQSLAELAAKTGCTAPRAAD
jgi:glutaredoxin